MLPWLYLKSVSTNDFDEALRALFGESVKGLSPPTIARLKRGWETEYAEWRRKLPRQPDSSEVELLAFAAYSTGGTSPNASCGRCSL